MIVDRHGNPATLIPMESEMPEDAAWNYEILFDRQQWMSTVVRTFDHGMNFDRQQLADLKSYDFNSLSADDLRELLIIAACDLEDVYKRISKLAEEISSMTIPY